MNTIWLKIAAAAVAVVIAIIVVGRFSSDKPAPSGPEKQKTFYDMADRDKQFNEPPKPVEEPPAQPVQEPAPQPAPQPEPQPAPQPPVQQTTPVPTMAQSCRRGVSERPHGSDQAVLHADERRGRYRGSANPALCHGRTEHRPVADHAVRPDE